eukprot:sb/3473083/
MSLNRGPAVLSSYLPRFLSISPSLSLYDLPLFLSFLFRSLSSFINTSVVDRDWSCGDARSDINYHKRIDDGSGDLHDSLACVSVDQQNGLHHSFSQAIFSWNNMPDIGMGLFSIPGKQLSLPHSCCCCTGLPNIFKRLPKKTGTVVLAPVSLIQRN